MRNLYYNLFLITILSLVFINCANRGTPSGGEKDITPPNIIKETPSNFSTNFNSEEIKIYFDEYVKIKNLQRQLIISPPMNTQPEITPLGGASKYITIKIFDTLAPNTTYALNFGNSIVDNNEENPFPYYRYVFSTGDYIDSLSVKGNIIDAKNREPEDFVSVMLYEVDSTFTDSIIYKQPPRYITNTLDSLTTFSIDNVKAGKYLLIALKDENQDYKFQQKSDKIGFHHSFINLPNDTLYTLKLFNEDIDFNATRPRLISGEKIAFGYEGDFKDMSIEIQSETPEDFKYRIIKDKEKDTLYYWYTPRMEVDSLLFKVKHPTQEKDFTVRISAQERDTLVISSSPRSAIAYNEDLKIIGTTPLERIDESKISIIDKDSLSMPFTTKLDSINNHYLLSFSKTESNKYSIQTLPEAFTDFFGNTNDTLSFNLSTKSIEEYGDVRVNLVNAKYPVIVQLTDDNGEVKYEQYSTKPEPVDFLTIDPAIYYLRVVFDSNENKIYDTGNYLKKINPERISHFGEPIEVRAYFEQTYNFTLLD